MSDLISFNGISKSFGTKDLFEDLSLSILEGDRLGVIGPNGAGKSTFMKIAAGHEEADEGSVITKKKARIIYVPQSFHLPLDISIQEAFEQSLAKHSFSDLDREITISKYSAQFGFKDPTVKINSLSGGWKKRLAIALGACQKPDLLLLDEPTNHLDMESILWLEKYFKSVRYSFAVISHDRSFLNKVCSRVVEINRVFPQSHFLAKGNLDKFLESKRIFLEGQEQYVNSLSNKVRRETQWLNAGVKARTTKQQARIDQARDMISELSEAKKRMKTSEVEIEFKGSDRKTKVLIKLNNVSKSFGEKTILSGFDFDLLASMRLGVLGRNASGKSTFLKLLMGDLEPDSGTVKKAHDLKVIYFAQDRESLDPGDSVLSALTAEGDHVVVGGRKIHAVSWLKKFMFKPEQLHARVGTLSGGEQAKLIIARLMTKEADLLILDEPTNDLDLETLEVLEQGLLDFEGCVVFVTHDRFMLSRVSNKFLALEGDGQTQTYASLEQWMKASLEAQAKKEPTSHDTSVTKPKKKRAANTKKKLSYMEQREFDGIEGVILETEELVERLKKEMTSMDQSDHQKMTEKYEELNAAQKKVSHLYERWEHLSEKQAP